MELYTIMSTKLSFIVIMIITLIILSMIMIIPSKASRQHGSWVQLDCHLKQVISMMMMMMRQ